MQDYFRKTIKMNIQLLSISHKTARASLRGRFVFDSEQTKDILKQLTEPDGQQENTGIEEAVLISTCNRTELYCSGTPENQNFIRMQHVLLAAAGIEKNSETYYHRVIDSYLEDVLRLARWGRFSVLGHLTLPLRYMNENLGEQMTFDGHYDQCREIFRALIESGCGIECNTNRGNVPLPDAPLLKLYRETGGEIITIGSDAHSAEYVGCCVRETQALLRTCGFRYFCTFEGGKPTFRKL